MTINALSLITAQSNRKPYKFDIPNSLRFNDQSETKFTRTFSGLSSDVTTATLSFWVKRTKLDHEGTIICRDGNPWFCVFAANKLATRTNPGGWHYYSDRVYRDPYAWYHIFIKVNSSDCTLYVNGQLEGTATYPGAILTTGSSELRLGYESSNSSHFAGYLSEFYFIDETNSGSSLDVDDFGRTDKYGNWVPKKVTNTNYGNNGFYLDFSDVNDIGADRSGNNNHFTPSGFDTTITTDTVTNIATSTGTDYLSGASYSLTTQADAEYAFDSSLGTSFNGRCAPTTGSTQSCSTSKATSTITLGSAIPINSSLRVRYFGKSTNIWSTHYSAALYFKINGTSYGSGFDGPVWVTVPTGNAGITSITSIGIEGSNQSDNCCATASFYAIEVDGVILKSNDTEYTLTFNTGTSISSFSRGDIVYQSPSVYGTVLSVDSGNKKITLGLVTGTFVTDKTVYKSIAEQDNYFNYDYMNDSPTNNYATWNTLTPYVTTSRGGLNITNQRNCTTTFGKFKTGKYYFEWNATQAGYIGVTDNIDSWGDDTTPFAHSDDSLGYYAANQSLYRNSSTGVVYGPVIQSGTLAMAVDFDNGTIEYFHNGSSIGYATTVTSALTSGKEYYIAGQGLDTTNDIKTNFGQQPFRHTPPVGFVGLHRKTLPAKKFIDGTDHFRTILGSDFKKGPITDKEVISGANWTYTDLFIHNTPYGGIIPENLLLDTSLNNLNSGSSTVSAHIGLFSAVVEHRYEFEFDPPIPSSLIQWRRHGGLGFSDGDAIVTKADDSTVNITASEVPISPYTGTTSTNYDIKKVFIRNRSTQGAATTANYVYFSITDTNGNKKIFYNERFKLKFNNSNNFNLFPVRSIVSTSQDATARGIVTEVDTANNTITVGVTTGNFNVGDDLVLFKSQIISASQETFPSGLWWIKDRENLNQHQLVDSFNGTSDVWQVPNATGSHTYSAPSGNSVAWCWKAGGAAVSNGNGSITSSVSANIDAGFSIVQYTGNGSNDQTVGHGLGKTPEFIFLRGLAGATTAWHHLVASPANGWFYLQTTQAWNNFTDDTIFQEAGMSTTTFGIGSDTAVNQSTTDYTAYVWTSVPGYSAFGKYSSNNDSDGPVIITGFKPSFLLVKRTTVEHWQIIDSTRNISNPINSVLQPSATSIEHTNSVNDVDFLSNGFKIRNTGGPFNSSTNEYIYAAFAEKPSFAKNFSSANPR